MKWSRSRNIQLNTHTHKYWSIIDLFSHSPQCSVWSISLRPGQTQGVESVTAVSSFPRAIGQLHIKKSRDDCVQSESMRARYRQWHFYSFWEETVPLWLWSLRSVQAMGTLSTSSRHSTSSLPTHQFNVKWISTQHQLDPCVFGLQRRGFWSAEAVCVSAAAGWTWAPN